MANEGHDYFATMVKIQVRQNVYFHDYIVYHRPLQEHKVIKGH